MCFLPRRHHRTKCGGMAVACPGRASLYSVLSDEIHYRILRFLEVRPDISQRQLAKELGVSVGKTNYCIQALLQRGWIKAENFKNSHNKIGYTYLLTPEGFERKAKIAVRFLKRKTAEFEAIKREIEQLRLEVAQLQSPDTLTGSKKEDL